MTSRSNHFTDLGDLSARLPSNAAWVGLVGEPIDRDVIPVVFVPELGIVDSLTWARYFVDVTAPLAHHYASAKQDTRNGSADDLDDDWVEDAADNWQAIAEPLTENPTPHLLAIAAVALQRRGLELGRQWLTCDLGLAELKALNPPADDDDPALKELWEWTSRRWPAQPHPAHQNLHPSRALRLELAGEHGLHVLVQLAYRVAYIAIGIADHTQCQIAATRPELVLTDNHQEHGTQPIDDPWAPDPYDPPF